MLFADAALAKSVSGRRDIEGHRDFIGSLAFMFENEKEHLRRCEIVIILAKRLDEIEVQTHIVIEETDIVLFFPFLDTFPVLPAFIEHPATVEELLVAVFQFGELLLPFVDLVFIGNHGSLQVIEDRLIAHALVVELRDLPL